MSRLVAFLLTVLLGWLFAELRPTGAASVSTSRDEHRTPEPAPKPTTTTSPTVLPDDLTRIKGIGPAAAQALNQLGIYTFRQLAQQNVEDLARRLPGTMGARAKRDQWIQQAQQLARQ